MASRWIAVVLCAALQTAVLVLVLLWAIAAGQARDLNGRYASSELRDWYAAQRNGLLQACCDDADGHEVTQWGRGPAGYWVEFDGQRHQVPPELLVAGSHPYGKAVVWIWRGKVRCFLPGMEG